MRCDAAIARATVRTDAAHHGLPWVLPDEAIAVLRTDSTDTIRRHFRVTSRSGEFLAGDRDLSDAARGGALVR